MEAIFKKIFSFAGVFPVVRADDGELVDPQVTLRAECEKKHCASYFEKLETCNKRVLSKKKTTESCAEEMVDFIECLDHCVSENLFSKLK